MVERIVSYLTSGIFFYSIEMLVSFALFCFKLERRKFFALRLSLYIIVYEIMIFLFVQFLQPLLAQPFTVWFALVISLFSVVICFKVTFKDYMFVALGAIALQHLMSIVVTLINYFIKDAKLDRWVYNIIRFSIDGAVGCIVYWFFAKRIKRTDNVHTNNFRFLVIALVMFVSAYIVRYFQPEELYARFICNLYSFICTVLALCLQFSEFNNDNAKWEKRTIEQMMNSERTRYELSQANIDSINRKCHDLRSHIDVLKQIDEKEDREKLISQLKDDIIIYDNIAKTGNAALDNTLTEKLLYCKNQGITFTYIVDGKKLDFINSIDIVMLFGNAIDNAIESVMKISDKEKRIISLHVSKRDDMLKIHLENYCEENVVMDNGMPVTSKNQKEFHGFGTKSIRYIAENYGGFVNFNIENSFFNMNIVIPMNYI